MARAVFLDRDGVLTRSEVRHGKPYAPVRLVDLCVLPDAVEATQALHAGGWRLIVVTNQPDVASGALGRDVLEQMHARLRHLLPLDDIKVCCHVDTDGCACRKPRPGLLLSAAAELGIELLDSFMVGDRWRDVSAGRAAGCRTILVDRGYSEHQQDTPDFVVRSLLEASQVILRFSS